MFGIIKAIVALGCSALASGYPGVLVVKSRCIKTIKVCLHEIFIMMS
jgi:hypothetical protein